MNLNSKKSLEDLKKNQINYNIQIHKIFLLVIIIIDILLIIFIITYKSKISEIKLKYNVIKTPFFNKKSNIVSKDRKTINHKLVNIFAISMSYLGNFHFSLIFDNSEEVKMVKEFVKSFRRKEFPYLLLIYQGNVDKDESSKILDIIKYYKNILLIIKTKNGEKLGFFFDGAIIPNKYGFFESNNYNCFIFSFQEKARYFSKVTNNTFEVNKEVLFNIGNGDIEINHNFHTYGGKINFPFKSFFIPENKGNIFKKINGQFDIKDIEIYTVIEEGYDYYDLRRIIFS